MLNTEYCARIIPGIIPFLNGCKVDLIDVSGIVIGSTDIGRTGTYSEEAMQVLESAATLEMRGENLLFRYHPLIVSYTAVGVALIWGQPEPVTERSEPIASLINALVMQLIQDHMNENNLKMQNSYISEWLFSNPQQVLSDESFFVRGKLLGIEVNVPRSIALLRFISREDMENSVRLKKQIHLAVKNASLSGIGNSSP